MWNVSLGEEKEKYYYSARFAIANVESGGVRLPNFIITLQSLYNTVRYITVLDITRFKDGSQKCIDYIEKWP